LLRGVLGTPGQKPYKNNKSFRPVDLIIIFLCIVGACFSGAAFWREYNNTLERLNEEPVGTIIFQRRVAQRRFIDRNMWDRLQLASFVYNGDTIRTIEQSEAIVIFDDAITHLNLNENTMIQIFFHSQRGTQVEFFEGNLEVLSETGYVVVTSGTSTIVIEGQAMMDKNEDGFVMSVSEGQATFDGIEIEAGNVIVLDSHGEISTNPIISMTSFGPFASFLGRPGEAVPVVFSWNSFFFTPDTYVIVEIAADRRFNRLVETREITYIHGGPSSISVSLEHGIYWWRAFPAIAGSRTPINRLFPSGSLEILPAVAPLLLSPPQAEELIFPAEALVPLSWSAVEGASAYLVEISAHADIRSPAISRRVAETSVTQAGLDYGRWHWRVTPLFPPQIRGDVIASAPGEFSVIRGSPILAAPLPAPVSGNRLMWNHDPNASSWLVELADNPAMINPAVRQNATSNFFSLSPELLQAQQTWYWRITALGGAYPAVSAVQMFEASHDRPPIARPPVIAPPPRITPAVPEPPVEVAALPAIPAAPEPTPPLVVPVTPEAVPAAPAELAALPTAPAAPAVLPEFPPIIFSANLGNWYALGDETIAGHNLTLSRIVQFLEANSQYRLRVEGHANATVNPADTANHLREHIEELQPLSEIRAQIVADRLVELGADPARLDVAGIGGERPLAAWENRANWWRNRRAEFVFATEN